MLACGQARFLPAIAASDGYACTAGWGGLSAPGMKEIEMMAWHILGVAAAVAALVMAGCGEAGGPPALGARAGS